MGIPSLMLPNAQIVLGLNVLIKESESLNRKDFESLSAWRSRVVDFLYTGFVDNNFAATFKLELGLRATSSDFDGRNVSFLESLPKSVKYLKILLMSVEQGSLQIDLLEGASGDDGNKTQTSLSQRVFIVHGHDETKILQVKEVLRTQNLVPVVLNEQPNGGRTIIEKFEFSADVGFAIALLTSDDLAANKSEREDLKPRARQNVILELGYFIGRLGRSRVCALMDVGLEVPSDIHGVVYTPFDQSGAWRYTLAKELRLAGYSIDTNLIP